MIVTVTCNPAIDKTIYENKVVYDIGGKGINVSKVLNNLNSKSIVTGFIGRENKDIVINDLNSLNIENYFIEVDGRVRTNTKRIKNNQLFEKNEDGPYISESKINELFNYLKCFSNDIFIISGSTPSSVNKNIYFEMINLLKENNNYVILDCSKELLANAIKAKPNIIKPNKEEICELLEVEYDEKQIISKCKDLDIELICLSLGEDGAIFIGEEINKCNALNIKCSSSVGAGDAMVAAIAYGIENKYDEESIIKLAMAASGTACETIGTKPPKYKEIMDKINDVIIIKQ